MMNRHALGLDADTSPATVRRERFENAWRDLGERLESGIRTLAILATPQEGDGPEQAANQARLTAKSAGLAAAQADYQRIDTATDRTADPDWAFWTWQDQKIAVFDAYSEAMGGGEPARAEGLALALDYMRGYSHEIDIPSLPILLRGASEGNV